MKFAPTILRVLSGRVEQRTPYSGEIEFFRRRPDVAGLAAEDGRVVLNPFSEMDNDQMAAVALNEAARIFMVRENIAPMFELTQEQANAFADYGTIEFQRATVAARLLSRDPSALQPSNEQLEFVEWLRRAMLV